VRIVFFHTFSGRRAALIRRAALEAFVPGFPSHFEFGFFGLETRKEANDSAAFRHWILIHMGR
jgi:hypothetical protein